eukprot:CAMPEP_0206226498 /NCGR_PEP_ID=MMETSP0047_2-20121206/8131_1 /ASSEMBLY_ACC=CAM_ASM_000192 /TAXON_ID=195065 /ORGANISM="Chroomonas mesostigmatica_cf, Strain CCMP1168" /LENGTH=151 /DNA_ID=CAMNT_0053649605 /DNA_START=452 /DNA_END=906 /DNA_ORIENTATION=+
MMAAWISGMSELTSHVIFSRRSSMPSLARNVAPEPALLGPSLALGVAAVARCHHSLCLVERCCLICRVECLPPASLEVWDLLVQVLPEACGERARGCFCCHPHCPQGNLIAGARGAEVAVGIGKLVEQHWRAQGKVPPQEGVGGQPRLGLA